MSSHNVPIHRTSGTDKTESWFDAFSGNDAHEQANNIRWLSRPNQQLVQSKYSHQDTEKFRITFDVENFKPDQIKLYIQNRKLIISGVYEERTENRYMQKQFEKSFDLPATADVEAMASYITEAHMLVVEIPLNPNATIDHLDVSKSNNDRRLSFSLGKAQEQFLTELQGRSPLAQTTSLPPPGQQVRRTSITKTTTTTTTTSSGSGAIPSEASELLRQAHHETTGSSSNIHSSSTHTTQQHTYGGGQHVQINEPTPLTTSSNTSSGATSNQTLSSSELSSQPVKTPSELSTSGDAIMIIKRNITITETSHGEQPSSSTQHHQTSSSLTNDRNSTNSSSQQVHVQDNTQKSDQKYHETSSITTDNRNTSQSVPVLDSTQRPSQHDQTSSSTTTSSVTSKSQQVPIIDTTQKTDQSSSSTQRQSSTLTSNNSQRQFTLEEFLQNKTWNPSLVDGPSSGKKILYMRLQMKPGTKHDDIKITLKGFDLRVEVNSKTETSTGRYTNEHSYRQVTLFPTCDVDQLKTEYKDDNFLHIQVPITL